MVLERCQVHEPDPDDDGFGRCTCSEGALAEIGALLVTTGRTSARARCTCGAGSDEDCSGPGDHIPPCPASQPSKGAV